MDLAKFIKARKNRKIKKHLHYSELIIPTSPFLASGPRFLGLPKPAVYTPFDFIIKMLNAIERVKGTLYLLGGQKEELDKIAGNLRDSFPGIRIVGRFSGYFSKSQTPNVITAIKKSSPSLLLVGPGVPGKEGWLFKYIVDLNPGLYLWCEDFFKIICGKKKKISIEKYSKKTWYIGQFFRRPWLIFQLRHYFKFRTLLFIAWIKKDRSLV